MPNDALIVAQQAYQMSGQKYAILPFAIAQIYVSLVSDLENWCHVSLLQQIIDILIILMFQGNYDKANVMYEESLKLQPDFTEAKRRHQALDCLW